MEAAKGLSAEDLQLLLNRAPRQCCALLCGFILSCVSVMQVVVEVQEAGAHKFISILGFLLGCAGGDGAGGGGAAGELKSSGPRLFPTCVSGVEVRRRSRRPGFHSCLLIWGLPLR